MSENTIPIPARLKNVSEGGHVAGAADIIDDVKNKTQDAINVEVDNTLTLHQSEINALDSQNYVTVDTYSDLPATGSVDTVYRVCNWDGSANSGEGAVDATVYSEYAWDDTGSDYKLLDVKTAIGEVFDISLYNAVGGVLATYADLSAALGVDGANVPSGVRKGGMSVKYVSSSDNKYVQCRLTSDEWTTDTTQWAITEEGVYVENPEFVYVKTDAEDKILWAIKADGEFVFGVGVPKDIKDYILAQKALVDADVLAEKVRAMTAEATKVDKVTGKGLSTNDFTNEEKHVVNVNSFQYDESYMQATTDSDDKVLEGIKANGTKQINTNVELNGDLDIHGNNILSIEHTKYIEVKTDSTSKIIEGITADGKKHISQFDKETESVIREIAGNSDGGSNVIEIPLLDANFISPVPVTITGTKGNENAKYEFELPLSEGAFNIRFKFKITENILNQGKSAVIAKLGNNNTISASSVNMEQLVTTVEYNSETKNLYWCTLKGGISLNGSFVNRTHLSHGNQNIGLFAFYVKYIGSEDEAFIENDGTKLIFTAGSSSTEYSFTTYPTVYELYAALRNRDDVEVSYNELENRNCSELAKFSSCKIKGLFYSGINGESSDTIHEYVDAAPFFIPYAVSETWHKVEIVKIGGTIHVACDGIQTTLSTLTDNTLTLGGTCGVLFKDLVVHTESSYDAEIASNGYLISSMNPYILIHEGHGIDKVPIGDGYVSDNMATSVDRLQYVYSIAKSKGYIPVSIKDIADYYIGVKDLPKRCFTIIFDDYRFENCMDIENRAVFTRLGIKPALAIVSGRSGTITHNGETITLEKAVDICRMNNFDLFSHTRNHRKESNTKPSTYMSEFISDIYDADIHGIDNTVVIYPYGDSSAYEYDTMQWLGIKAGISIYEGVTPKRNTDNRTRYRLVREEIGFRENIDNILSKII